MTRAPRSRSGSRRFETLEVRPDGEPRATRTRRRPNPRTDAVRPDERALGVLLLAAFVTLGVTLVLHHEPWRDEADPWLMARDVGLVEMFHRAGYFGSPALWYYLQMPFAKLGFPYLTMSILNLAFAVVAVALLIFRAPFPFALRALMVSSFFFSYEYAVIARSYAMSLMFLFAIATLHRRRFQRPGVYGLLILGLFNTNVHSFSLAGAFALLFVWDVFVRKRLGPRPALAGLGAALGGGALAVLQVLPPTDGQFTGLVSQPIDLGWIVVSLGGAFLPTLESEWGFQVLAAFLYSAIVVSLLRSPRALVFLVLASLGLWYVLVFKYAGELRHWGFLLLTAITALWIGRAEEEEEGERAFRLSLSLARGVVPAARALVAFGLSATLVWSTYVAQEFWRRDLRDPFSGSRAMARYMREHGWTRLPVAAWPAPHAEAVLPYLPFRQFYYPGIRDHGSYMKWDRNCVAGWHLSEDEVLARVEEAFPDGEEVLLLVNQPMSRASERGFRLVYAAIGPVMMGDEQYFLYHRGDPRRAGVP